MSDWIISLAGTPEGARLATLLALLSAFAHALFGALQKGRLDPWMARGVMDIWLVIFSIPLVMLVPLPDAGMWLILAGSVAIHFTYKVTVALAYERGAYTVVYPVIRGAGVLFTVLAASVVFSERFSAVQWGGVALVSGGIIGLALRNMSEERLDRRMLLHAILWAGAGGLIVAIYTTYDAWGIRSAADPFTFLAWFFLLSSLDFGIIAIVRYRRAPARFSRRDLLGRGISGALIAYISFGGIMLATRLDQVGEAAVLRETSVVFAAMIGALFLRERVGPRKAALMAVIALGAVVVEAGG